MKRIITIFSLIISIAFTGCLKDNPNVDFSNIGAVVELPYSGLGDFGSDALNFTSDTITLDFTINVASPYPPDHDITVTVGVDPSLTAAFNSSHADQYEDFPSDAYVFPDQTITIEKGTRLDTFSVTFYKPALDPAKSYMLPITIKDAAGETVSGDYGTHYFHFIGNPLAGAYNQSFYRWNDVPDTTGPPNSTVFENEPVTITPVNSTTIFLPEGYLDANGLGGVSLSFTNNNGEITDPNLFIDDATQGNIDDAGFKVVTAPTMISYQIVGDASTHYSGTTFRFYFEIVNSTGGNRKTINVFTKQ
jgi:hypothetical protein